MSLQANLVGGKRVPFVTDDIFWFAMRVAGGVWRMDKNVNSSVSSPAMLWGQNKCAWNKENSGKK